MMHVAQRIAIQLSIIFFVPFLHILAMYLRSSYTDLREHAQVVCGTGCTESTIFL